jgi:hypothetical protein
MQELADFWKPRDILDRRSEVAGYLRPLLHRGGAKQAGCQQLILRSGRSQRQSHLPPPSHARPMRARLLDANRTRQPASVLSINHCLKLQAAFRGLRHYHVYWSGDLVLPTFAQDRLSPVDVHQSALAKIFPLASLMGRRGSSAAAGRRTLSSGGSHQA